MKFTIQTHDSYPEDNRLELPAVDFHKSRKIEGYWQPRLVHSAMTAETFPHRADRIEALTSVIIPTMLNRLTVDERDSGSEVDYTLHVYLIPEDGN